nr:MAG TPA: hypothetical protein [Caudoviricetes sp.]
MKSSAIEKTPISLFTSGRAPPGCIREAAFNQDAGTDRRMFI